MGPGATTSPELLALPELVTHLEAVCHPRTRRLLEEIGQRIAEARRGAPALVALAEAAQVQQELERELSVHMQKEEQLLFPYARLLHAASAEGRRLHRPAFHSVRNPIEVLGREHDAVAYYLDRLTELTQPPDALPSLTQACTELVSDLGGHIGLERQLLFPRLLELEAEVLTDGR